MAKRFLTSMKDHNNKEENVQKKEYTIDDRTKKVLNCLKGRKEILLGDAVSYVSSSVGIRPEEAAKCIYQLREGGMIMIRDTRPPATLHSYFLSAYSIWFWLIVALVSGAVYTIYWGQFTPFIYIRYVLGSMLILYLPGAALIELLYPKKSDLSQLVRIVLSSGLSLVLVLLIGFVLNYTPWGIMLDPTIASLSLLTLCLAAGAVVRKYGYLKLFMAGTH